MNKKDLKREYKNMKPKMGVFQIKNRVNGRVLVEGSLDIDSKWNRHKTELRFGSHRNAKLQDDWTTYKPEDFEFSVLSELETKDEEIVNYASELKALTQLVIEELKIADENKY